MGVGVADYEVAHGEVELSLSEPQERDFGGRSDTGRDADGSDSARNVGNGISCTVESMYEGCEEAGRVDGLVEDFDRDLPAMSVTRKQQIITLTRGYGKDVGVMLQQNVGRAGEDEALGALQIAGAFAVGLEVEAGEVEGGIAEAQRLRLAAYDADDG